MTLAPSRTGTPSLDVVRNALVATLIMCVPFAIEYLLVLEVHSPHLQRPLLGATTIGVLELLFALLAVAALPLLFRRETYRGAPLGLIGVLAFAVATAILVAVNPGPEGLVRIVRWMGVVGLVVTVRWMTHSTFRLAVVWPLTVGVAMQGTWAVIQTFVLHNGHHSGITVRWADAWTQGYGSMDGGYALAAFVVLGMAIILSSSAFSRLHPAMWLAVGIGSLSLSTTFGRSGIVAAVAIGALFGIAAVIRRDRTYGLASAVTLFPMSLGVLTAWQGWSVRASETADGKLFGRESLLQRAFTVIGDHPWFGVGPGKYGPALAKMGLTDVDITIVHNVPVLIAAEYGVPLGVLFFAWLAALVITTMMTSVRATAVLFAIAPYLIFDHPHVVYAYGVAEFGLWLAVLDFHRLARAKPEVVAAPAAISVQV